MRGETIQKETIQKKRLSDEVAARLEGMIRSGEYTAGDQLPSERALMERFGVGRPSVREALYTLRRMGLVATSSGGRARVTRPTPRSLLRDLDGTVQHFLSDGGGERHFQEARLFFEVGLARHAAELGARDDIERLGAALAANRRALRESGDAFERTDVAFHYVLAKIPRNPVFVAIHEAVASWLTRQRTLSLRNPDAAEDAYAWHVRIYDAVRAGDADAAEAAMRGHLERVSHLYWRARTQEQ